MKIMYVPKNFSQPTLDLITDCNLVIERYQDMGYVLTLRQLYYQLVASGLIPNQQRAYKRLVNVVGNARDAGLIDWDAIEDRTRKLEKVKCWDGPAEIVGACADQFKYDHWDGQSRYVEVWVEKEALSGVIKRTCEGLDVPWVACRGYMSQSEVWKAGQRFRAMREHDDRDVTVIHLGDHDPSGIDMTRDNADRLSRYAGRPVNVERIALNMDQVRRFNPPPNPAKVTDSRFASYVALHGGSSWELDALDPVTLDEIITDAVKAHRDEVAYEAMKDKTKGAREDLREVADNWLEAVRGVRRDH